MVFLRDKTEMTKKTFQLYSKIGGMATLGVSLWILQKLANIIYRLI